MGSLIKYYVTARDDEGLMSRGPSQDASDHYVLVVGNRTATVRISRFNAGSFAADDEDEGDAGWIELHNYGAEAVNLGDLHLANETHGASAYPIPPSLALGAQAHLIFIADNRPEERPDPSQFSA